MEARLGLGPPTFGNTLGQPWATHDAMDDWGSKRTRGKHKESWRPYSPPRSIVWPILPWLKWITQNPQVSFHGIIFGELLVFSSDVLQNHTSHTYTAQDGSCSGDVGNGWQSSQALMLVTKQNRQRCSCDWKCSLERMWVVTTTYSAKVIPTLLCSGHPSFQASQCSVRSLQVERHAPFTGRDIPMQKRWSPCSFDPNSNVFLKPPLQSAHLERCSLGPCPLESGSLHNRSTQPMTSRPTSKSFF